VERDGRANSSQSVTVMREPGKNRVWRLALTSRPHDAQHARRRRRCSFLLDQPMSLLGRIIRPICLAKRHRYPLVPLRTNAPLQMPWLLVTRHRSDTSPASVENTNVSHAGFIADASAQKMWKESTLDHEGEPHPDEEGEDAFDNITSGRGMTRSGSDIIVSSLILLQGNCHPPLRISSSLSSR
jgi:hypothetical protein